MRERTKVYRQPQFSRGVDALTRIVKAIRDAGWSVVTPHDDGREWVRCTSPNGERFRFKPDSPDSVARLQSWLIANRIAIDITASAN